MQTVERFNADVSVWRGGEKVGGTSIMGLMMLAAGPGTYICIEANGPQADEVIAALEALINSRFGEDEYATPQESTARHAARRNTSRAATFRSLTNS